LLIVVDLCPLTRALKSVLKRDAFFVLAPAPLKFRFCPDVP
jgi:hypothetical protein